ncbi:MAG TPA: murein biosynthesis integral membrane protein MurJ [Acetivibrio sp.]|uniref:murein biosynthesis integral membrane protein MurJ n=1 Tax=Acetivibrio sp. TaxID=1872092 RepID=UPI002B71FE2F|nr:murein biosynthesis integral membrane protein MurJ [Acetivibrio sp.]HOM01463.1 murein biosynthesis integral membrane protein MurJ [Acetivibrio sp.]
MGKNKKLTSAALIVMSSIVVSRMTGFLREMLVPNLIGVNEAGDAYTIAFRITGLMYDMLVGGAVSAALIPILSGYIARDDEETGWKVVGTFINTVIVAMVVMCFLGIFFAPWLVSLIAIGFESEAQRQLTVDLMRILFPSVAFLMMAGLCNGVLNSYNRFAAAAYGPSLYNIGSAVSIIVFSNSKWSVRGVAFGVMISSLIYFLFQLSFAAKNLKHYKFKFYLKHQGSKRLFKLAIPSLMSSAIVQINAVISGTFATLFGVGGATALNIGDRTWQLPYGVFAQGMGIAMLPSLSANIAKGEVDEYKNTLIKGIKTVLFFTVPSGIGFIVLREPIIRTIFKFTNRFDEGAVSVAGNVLMFFSIALLSQSVVTVMNRAFYAVNDTFTPLLIGGSTIIINILLSFVFYKTTNLGVAGMALAYSLASALNAFLLLTILSKKMKGIYLDRLLRFLLKVVPSALIMGIVVFITNTCFVPSTKTKVMQLLYLIFQIALGALVYSIAVLALRVEEASYFKDMVLSKFKKLVKK